MKKGLYKFNNLGGRLRVSITHACQLKCVFCHQEGIDEHWKPIHMSKNFFIQLIKSFNKIQGKELNITGGDPLLHPNVDKFIEIASNPNWKLALCTNGLLLERVFSQIKHGLIDEIKLSVHADDNEEGRKLLGKAWSLTKVEKNVERALSLGANFTVNYTHTQKNSSFFHEAIKRALDWNANFLAIDLISTRWAVNQSHIGRQEFSATEKIISKYAKYIGVKTDGTGCRMKIYKTSSGKTWMIKDVNYGLLYTNMCKGCSLKQNCGEGVFVLRVDAKGTFKPCLLRRDLEEKIELPANQNEVEAKIRNMIELMFSDSM